MYRTGNQNEIQEAKTAGRQALEALEEAEDFLQSARNMGIWDMLGGGLLADIMKHSRLDKATRCLEAAREQVEDGIIMVRTVLEDLEQMEHRINIAE
ncbi:hypothetical protein GKG47_18860 [Lactonifactor sp. BIOML-A3]|uniref:hypothetical protein n=1 Tax=unclassified Lactonifactor TaxID=2636670 RepID=UPI0012B02C58|nr:MULTISPECIES: hypothetical protein [unclassified Lactonifactor]MSA03534.1 hypothetical protein [Lactonifactor sp. BIOML-A5]MSA07266.1 hypothetical protein [Lactonifactor sp. BIOML-A4]MSA14486.1 hypothetical protein [Lactonifactor sp. BIOML-A3]MSA18889.1 hypothetical protein [Lactonifactor sp. BIOML-A2]MSA37247.1 hypothetical protein [Lactonifactor sp. BIOML-A1]